MSIYLYKIACSGNERLLFGARPIYLGTELQAALKCLRCLNNNDIAADRFEEVVNIFCERTGYQPFIVETADLDDLYWDEKYRREAYE